MTNELMIPHEETVRDLLMSGWAPASISLHIKERYQVEVSYEDILEYAKNLPDNLQAPFAVLRKHFDWRAMYPDLIQAQFDLLATHYEELEAIMELMDSLPQDSKEYEEAKKDWDRKRNKLWEMNGELMGVRPRNETSDTPETSERTLEDIAQEDKIIDVKAEHIREID
jgi:hypothetical protein